MKMLLMLLLSVLSVLPDPQETIKEIKSGSTEIIGKMGNSVYQQDRTQYKSFISILNLDVSGYYDDSNMYGNGSGPEDPADSLDFETKHNELSELKDQMISTNYYLDFIPDYYDERSVRITYDQETGSFSVSNEVHSTSFYDDPGFIQIDWFLFKCPEGITVNKRNINYACIDMIAETISFEITDPDKVSKMVKNTNKLRLLFVFNITGTTSAQSSAGHFFMTYLRYVVAYNSESNEIYATYKQND